MLQILHKAGPRLPVSLANPDPSGPDGREWLRSLDISSNGRLLAVGTDREHLLLVSRDGQLVRRLRVSNHGNPVEAAFTPAGTQLLVTGWWNVGLMELDGRWAWRHESRFARIVPDKEMSTFAAWFTPAHGPQGGMAEILDARGVSVWTSGNVWEPHIAMAPDGSFVAVSAIPMRSTMPTPDELPDLSIVDRSGRVWSRRQVDGHVESISNDGTCVFLRESGTGGRVDLVARDRALEEKWRFRQFYNGPITRSQIWPQSNLVIEQDRNRIATYRVKGCGGKGF
jgi:hypothetical protein